MRKLYVGLTAAVLLVALVFVAFVLYSDWPLLAGKRLVLAAEPADPFDIYEKRYFMMHYDIARVAGAYGYVEGDTVYVTLQEDERGIWRKGTVSATRPRADTFIRGEVTSVFGDSIRIEYGIEQYFVERYTDLPTDNITAVVGVSGSGRARLSQVLHDGEPIEIEYGEYSIRS
jgi:uncharacterized membrane-anchored protein